MKKERTIVTFCPEKFQTFDASKRLLIAISGIPGSGKTTVAASVVHGLNRRQYLNRHGLFPNVADADAGRPDPGYPNVALVVPLDGYHFTRQQLSEMPNAEEAIFRRGAAFTFDSRSYLELVTKLHRPIEPESRTIYAPSFDHAVKDPVANDIAIPPTARIIVLEGLYTALDADGWREAAQLMDELWFIQVPIDVATDRVAKRNFAAGISPTLEASLSRTKESDMRNGREILAHRLPVQEVIQSVEDDRWKSEEIKSNVGDESVDAMLRPAWRTERMDSVAEMAFSGVGL